MAFFVGLNRIIQRRKKFQEETCNNINRYNRRLIMNLENNNHKKNNIILALALIKHLYNKGDIPEHVYRNIKKEYVRRKLARCNC